MHGLLEVLETEMNIRQYGIGLQSPLKTLTQHNNDKLCTSHRQNNRQNYLLKLQKGYNIQ